MADGLVSEIGREDLREQLCNWLRLLELSGMKEMVMPAGSGDGCTEAGAVGSGEVGPSGSGSGATGEGAAATRPADAGGLEALRRETLACKACFLAKGRTKVVFGEGDPSAALVFIGEGPGADEDRQGEPFVGRAGMLLTKIIEAMGLTRQEVYIANVVKCRPPGNRAPEPDEIAACLPYLEKQIDLIKPKIICTLGNVATQTVTGVRSPISTMRGRPYDYRGVTVIPTFHPAACLRNPEIKKDVWEDVKKVMKAIDLPIRGVRGVSTNGPGKTRD
ncbi:MAG: uracil-DNA glycosylase [Candidatus Eisenbacteria bacterium]